MNKKLIFTMTSLILTIVVLSGCKPVAPLETTPSVDDIVGDWSGMMYLPEGGEPLGQLDIAIHEGCKVDKICGAYLIPEIPCGGTFTYKGLNGDAFRFEQQLTDGDIKICGTGSINDITLLEDGTLSQKWTDGVNKTQAILTRE